VHPLKLKNPFCVKSYKKGVKKSLMVKKCQGELTESFIRPRKRLIISQVDEEKVDKSNDN